MCLWYDFTMIKKQEFSQWHKVINQEIMGAKNILESCFINNKHSWVLWNKIFKTKICQKVFQYIEDLSIRTAKDAYIYFLIVYFSKSFTGKQTPSIYTYKLGNGISSKKQLNINEYIKLLINQRLNFKENILQSNSQKAEYLEREEKTFTYFDANNCQRNFDTILKLLEK